MPIENRRPELPEVLDRAIEKRLKATRTALPAVIDSYDASKQLCTVVLQIAETALQPDGTEAVQPPIKLSDIPVLFPGGGGFRITFPVKQGDRALLIISDRSLDEWKTRAPASGKAVAAADVRHHSLPDAVALVGLHDLPASWTVAPTDRATFGSDTGFRIEVLPGGVNLGAGASQAAILGDQFLTDLTTLINSIATAVGAIVAQSGASPVGAAAGTAITTALATFNATVHKSTTVKVAT